MIVRAIDIDGDFTFGKGKNDYKKDKDAVQQNIKTRLQSFIGDCFFALDEGIDWFNLLGSKRREELGLAVSAVILNTDKVTKIVDFSFDVDENRNVLFSYSVDTVYGIGDNSFQLEIGVF